MVEIVAQRAGLPVLDQGLGGAPAESRDRLGAYQAIACSLPPAQPETRETISSISLRRDWVLGASKRASL